ncbi:MAG TPA: flagellar motor switch protein FliN [Candidatus Aquicultor sp.]|jgi:flagellar motor switch protein FliN/FliY
MPRKKAEPAVEDVPQAGLELTDIEKSAIGEICDLITSSVLQMFSEKLDAPVSMGVSEVEVVGLGSLPTKIETPALLVQLNCASALQGQFFLFISGNGLPVIFDLAVPEEAKAVGADDEVILENLRNMINGAVAQAMTAFAESMGHQIDCSTVDTIVLQDESGFSSVGFLYPEGNLLSVATTLTLPESTVNTGYLLPVSLSSQIIELLLNEQTPAVSEVAESMPLEEAMSLAMADNEPAAPLDIPQDMYVPPISAPAPDMQMATFGAILESPGTRTIGGTNNNISLLLDVMLDASIELGKTTMTIEEILRLGKGSVIELDKLASEPVEFLVNGKVIARGEVVVIDDNFGIRITEILSPRERLENL